MRHPVNKELTTVRKRRSTPQQNADKEENEDKNRRTDIDDFVLNFSFDYAIFSGFWIFGVTAVNNAARGPTM